MSFASYIGPEIFISSLLTEPKHSLIHQSYHARERQEPLNGDGFGVSWFAPGFCDRPATFKEVSPAWNNPNLVDIARVTKSSCILAHVRAATVGGQISRSNCHPFTWKQFVFMHNGTVHGFSRIRRELRKTLSDEAYDLIKGSTDTEHLFAVFVDQISQLTTPNHDDIALALTRTIKVIEDLKKSLNVSSVSSLNLVVTDGKSLVASKYSTDNSEVNSLYYSSGVEYGCKQGEVEIKSCDQKNSSVLIVSEPLTKDKCWNKVDNGTLIIVDEERNLVLKKIIL